MNKINELIKQLEIGNITIEIFLHELEENPIKVNNKNKINIINNIKKQIIDNNNKTNNKYIIEHQKYFGIKDVLIIHKIENYELTKTRYMIKIY
jgi:hypothetical protein